MGLFSFFGRKEKEPEQIANIEGPGEFEIEVVGESHYQAELVEITGGKTEEGHNLEKDALLLFQDDNPHDNQAVAVTIEGKLVGYLDRKTARSFRKQVKVAGLEKYPLVCKALIVGGWDRGDGDEGDYGVRLDLP